ncbi:MAG TPA: methyltransferase [Alphaproteobacteria bacterium]|nr:methyltransferase [Alphaproteobacteria bacterium]
MSPSSRSLLDLGAGAGTAALVAMAHEPSLTATLVESDPEMAGLAALNLAENGFAGRGRVLTLDVAAPGRERVAAGLAADHFATVIANPPFFDPALGTAPAASRTGARHMAATELVRWVKAAAAHAAPGGEAIFIYPAAGLAGLLAAFAGRFGAITVLPLVPHAGEPASRILVRGSKGSRAPLRLLASRVLHRRGGGGFQPEFEAALRGHARLVW